MTPKASWRWAFRLAATTLACLVVVLAVGSPAAAHATLLGTDPAPGVVLPTAPEQASFRFNEPVSLPPEGVQLFDAAGTRIPAAATAVDAVVTVDLPDRLAGSYVITWRVVSADGHPVAGSLAFSVGQPSPVVTPPTIDASAARPVLVPLGIAQALMYLGLLLTVGLAVFHGFVLPTPPAARRLRDRISVLMRWSTGCGTVGAVAVLPLAALDQQGLGPAAVLSPPVWTNLSRSGATASVAVLAGLGLCLAATRPGSSGRWARTTLLAGVAVGSVGPSLSGHTRAVEPQALLIAIDILHVLAGGIWLGGLVGLAISLRSTRSRQAQAVAILSRFSSLAAGALLALVSTGTLLAWQIVGSWENLVGTGYGRLLLAKIGLAAAAAGIAGWNRFMLLPRVTRTRSGDARPARIRIARVVTVEAAVLVLLLGVTGFLVDQSPHAERATTQTRPTGIRSAPLGDDLTVLAGFVPAQVGQNRLVVQIQDAAGEPVEPDRPPTVRIGSDQLDLGTVQLTSEAAGTWGASVVLPTAGRWRVQVSLRISEFENPVTSVELPLA